jgi:hypothetical protein
MKHAYLRFSVIALDAKQFQLAKQCRRFTNKSRQNEIALEMSLSLEKAMHDGEMIDRYASFYAEFPILSISYGEEIVKLSLSEQAAALRSFIEQSSSPATQAQYQDICTGYINMKSSLFFPQLWPHPNHNLPRMISFSREYITFLSSKKTSWIGKSQIFETAPDEFMDDALFWELTGLHDQDSLDSRFVLVTKDRAGKMLDEVKDLKPKEEIREEDELFSSFLYGVLEEKTLLIFEYGD